MRTSQVETNCIDTIPNILRFIIKLVLRTYNIAMAKASTSPPKPKPIQSSTFSKSHLKANLRLMGRRSIIIRNVQHFEK